jgi:hypothetical protein
MRRDTTRACKEAVDLAPMHMLGLIQQVAVQTLLEVEEVPNGETQLKRDEIAAKHTAEDSLHLFFVDSLHLLVD